jgi:hypothetical protein
MNTKYTADIIQSGVHCMAVSLIAANIEYPTRLRILAFDNQSEANKTNG